MDYPEYAAFTERFGEEPSTFLDKLSFAQLLCIAGDLKIAFQPPYDPNEAEAVVRKAIIDVAVADFSEPNQEIRLVQAVEHCASVGT